MVDFDIDWVRLLVRKGLINESINGNLSLFNYSKKCQYEQLWCKYTIMCRGLVYDNTTEEIVARPLPKFFNYEEHSIDSRILKNVSSGKINVFEKMDGSLGILYHYDGVWNINTRGSFNSEQSIYARNNLLHNYNLDRLDKNLTHMVEIIYPENRIVVDYGLDEKLVFLCSVDMCGNVSNNTRYDHTVIRGSVGFDIPKYIDDGFISLISRKYIPYDNREGFVVYSGNNIVKIKFIEYVELSRKLQKINLKNVFVNCSLNDNDKLILDYDFIINIPEEMRIGVNLNLNMLRNEFNAMCNINETIYKEVFEKYETKKELTSTINIYGFNKISHYMYALHDNNIERFNRLILKEIGYKIKQGELKWID